MPLRTLVLYLTFIMMFTAHGAAAQSQTPLAQAVVTPWSDNGQNAPRAEDASRRYLYTRQQDTQNTQQRWRTEPQRNNRYTNQQQQYGQPQYQRTQQPTAPYTNYPPPNAAPLAKAKTEPSALESVYSQRIVDELEQFGYDLFGVPDNNTANHLEALSRSYETQREDAPKRHTPMGAVQDNFILNSGDEVEIMFTGQRNDRAIYKVSPQGMILIEDFPPIPAAGRSIGQVHFSIKAAAANLYNTESYISLASVKQIGVLVIGHVKKPGRRNLTVFNSVLDALMESGGIQKTGSLRGIKLVRHGRSTIIDLYTLLMHGGTNIDLTLRDGDRIIVPPIGRTVAVTGEIKRPGIYELPLSFTHISNKSAEAGDMLSLNDMLDLGGGVLISGQNRFIKLDINNKGQDAATPVSDPFKPQFGDGAILMVSKGQDKRSGTVEITGHTRKAGIHALSHTKTLSALIHNETVLGPDIYPLIGVIERWDTEQLTTKMLSFPLRLVLKKKFDRKLKDGDVVHLFSNAQMKQLQSGIPTNLSATELGSFTPMSDEAEELEELANNLPLQSFLKERGAYIRGAVRNEGAYPVGEGTTLDSLLAVAGGLTLEANTANIEITSALSGQGHQTQGRSGTRRTTVNLLEQHPKTIMVEAGDSVRVNTQFKKLKENSVLIMGEVMSPGRYDLLPGDKMSDLLQRAGGLSQQAYPKGAIFSRASERKAEESRFRAAARDLERSIAVAIEKGERENKDGPNVQKIAMAQELSSELRNVEAVGRITIEADPAVLSVDPELDILLESGDRLFIPKRPLTVRVSGEILSPASLQFRKNKDPLDYIHQAGGFTYDADKDRTFVLYPDGSAQPLQVSSWNHRATFIPPGSTIVVPRDPKPFDFVQSAKDISQILSNLAITGVFIDDIKDD